MRDIIILSVTVKKIKAQGGYRTCPGACKVNSMQAAHFNLQAFPGSKEKI